MNCNVVLLLLKNYRFKKKKGQFIFFKLKMSTWCFGCLPRLPLLSVELWVLYNRTRLVQTYSIFATFKRWVNVEIKLKVTAFLCGTVVDVVLIIVPVTKGIYKNVPVYVCVSVCVHAYLVSR